MRRPALVGWVVAATFLVVLGFVINSGPRRNESVARPNPDPLVAADDANAVGSADSNSEPLTVETSPNEIQQPREKAADDSEAIVARTQPQESVANVQPLPDAGAAPPPQPNPPVLVEPPPLETAESIAAKLKQKVARFDQTKPTAFVKLLDVVEELAGVPIVWDLEAVAEEQLQKPVTLHLQGTTVGEILDELLKQASLTRLIKDGRIELIPAGKQQD